MSNTTVNWLTHDLRAAFPEIKGFSPSNLKYIRVFANALPDIAFVQEVLAQMPRNLGTRGFKKSLRPKVEWEHKRPTSDFDRKEALCDSGSIHTFRFRK